MKFKVSLLATLASVVLAWPSWAADVTYAKDIEPLIKANCADCHAGDAPSLEQFNQDKEKYKKEKQGPRNDTYENLLLILDTGELIRRLDDGTHTDNKKPGNMNKYLGESPEDRLKALNTIKAWIGEGNWDLSRTVAKDGAPSFSKELLSKQRLKP